MRLDMTSEPITADDESIRRQVVDVPIPQLVASIAQLTGEFDLLNSDFLPDPALIATFLDDGYTPERRSIVHEAVAQSLIRFRDRGCPPASAPNVDELRALLRFAIAGEAVEDDYLTLLAEELALGGVDQRAPQWKVSELTPGEPFTAAVIGAGMSGIVAAHRLRQIGAEVRIFEKNAEVGGTWLENSYPGCRVDVPNHVYSYSFAQTADWPQFNSTQPVLLDYFRSCTREFGLDELISFETEVLEARWDERAQLWNLRVRGGDGVESTYAANVLVSAVGQLNRPSLPDIPGRESFAGPAFHSARWDHDVDFLGKRVAVIGTGASAVQFIPWLAERAAQLTVHQRTPAWLLPMPNYLDDIPPNVRWILNHVSGYARWDRVAAFNRVQVGSLPQSVVDPDWDLSRGSVSASNDLIRERLTQYIELVVADPKLRTRLIPDYPFGAKRMLLDSGIYTQTLQRPNVTLETGAIAAITSDGIDLTDGRHLEYDVLVYATGFQASKFLTPMQIIGRDGVDLHTYWDGDAKAYLGMTIPHFPNLFLLYGPNTNIVVNGSIVYFSELAARYITDSVRLLLANKKRSMEVRAQAHEEYNQRIDEATSRRSWGVTHVNSWYRNERGRIAQNWPYNLYEYWRETRNVVAEDYLLR
jgi:4-hydroxyacetophenone monooxygenase